MSDYELVKVDKYTIVARPKAVPVETKPEPPSPPSPPAPLPEPATPRRGRPRKG